MADDTPFLDDDDGAVNPLAADDPEMLDEGLDLENDLDLVSEDDEY